MFYMEKAFIMFLKKRGIYASYRKNVRLIGRYELKKGIMTSRFISYSLNYENTKEGYHFWESINDEWFRIYTFHSIAKRKVKDILSPYLK